MGAIKKETSEMQTRDMFKKPTNWKVLAGVAAVSAIGIGGLAVADSRGSENPEPITLTDQQSVTTVTRLNLTPAPSVVVPNDLDSPFDDADTESGDADASVTGDTPAGIDTLSGDTDDDSPEPAPTSAPAPVDDDSVSAGSASADSGDGSADS